MNILGSLRELGAKVIPGLIPALVACSPEAEDTMKKRINSAAESVRAKLALVNSEIADGKCKKIEEDTFGKLIYTVSRVDCPSGQLRLQRGFVLGETSASAYASVSEANPFSSYDFPTFRRVYFDRKINVGSDMLIDAMEFGKQDDPSCKDDLWAGEATCSTSNKAPIKVKRSDLRKVADQIGADLAKFVQLVELM